MSTFAMRLDDPDDIIDSLDMALTYVADPNTKAIICDDLKDRTFVGETIGHLSWHHALQMWQLAIYGEDDLTNGIVFDLSRKDVIANPPKPPQEPQPLKRGQLVNYGWMRKGEIEAIADEIMEVCPAGDREKIIEIIGDSITVKPVWVEIHGQIYKLVKEDAA